jgi:hypothetical protein
MRETYYIAFAYDHSVSHTFQIDGEGLDEKDKRIKVLEVALERAGWDGPYGPFQRDTERVGHNAPI